MPETPHPPTSAAPAAPRAPVSRIYDGRPYGWLVEPLIAALHRRIAARVPADARVLDACCGTGALSRLLAAQGCEVVGVDLSPKQIAQARRTRASGAERLRFETGDVAHLTGHDSGGYDVAVVTLALHEMPPKARPHVLRELARVAREVHVVDFMVPMPWNAAGLRNRTLEVLAGPEHFGGFRDFVRRGGLPPLVREAGQTVLEERAMDAGTLQWLRLAGDR